MKTEETLRGVRRLRVAIVGEGIPIIRCIGEGVVLEVVEIIGLGDQGKKSFENVMITLNLSFQRKRVTPLRN